MEKYIQIYSLSEAMDNETVCACYPHPSKNISGRKNEERMLNAEKEAKEGKCKLLVWRTINKSCGYLKKMEEENADINRKG